MVVSELSRGGCGKFGFVCSHEIFEELWINRWRDVQIDGSIEIVDKSISIMVESAGMLSKSMNLVDKNNVLDDVESIAYSAAIAMRRILALNPARQTFLPFDAGYMLIAAVEQFLVRSFPDICQSIEAGSLLAARCTVSIIPEVELSEIETGYRIWSSLRLVNHILPESFEYE